MKIEQHHLTKDNHYTIASSNLGDMANLVMYFGTRSVLEDPNIYHHLQSVFTEAIIFGSSTGGEIAHQNVHDDTVIAVAIHFDVTTLRSASMAIDNPDQSFEVGVSLGMQLNDPSLRGVFVLSDGLHVNGSALIHGVQDQIGTGIPIMGGLAGDGERFEKTLVGLNAPPTIYQSVAVGLYGDSIIFGHGSEGGWEVFGMERTITKSKGHVLYELDGKPALDLYKTYLGKLAAELPSSALLFPLSIESPNNPGISIVRTVLSVDEDTKSMTFAGNMPMNSKARLMRGTSRNLVQGARLAAEASYKTINIDDHRSENDALMIIISCIGRRILMGQRVIDEIDSVFEVFHDRPCMHLGFFSYGEISPHSISGFSELHNQTMTITTMMER